jgi:hypothetical protein
MEGAAALFNDSLLALDEISECDPRDVGAIVYSLGNGRGKQRAQRTGAARSVVRWRCMVISSGERAIATHMQEVLSVRLPENSATTSNGRTWPFGDLPDSHRYLPSGSCARSGTRAPQVFWAVASRSTRLRPITRR